MKYITLPRTDLRVSQICLGTVPFGSIINRDASFAVLDAYVEAGGTLLDTAHAYADWLGGERHMSEKTIGAWLRETGQRDRVTLATKGGHPDAETPLIPRLAPAQIAGDLDESLACLGVTQVDLYWLHRDDPDRPVGEIMETLHAQVEAGKIRYLGCSNWRHERIHAAQVYAMEHNLHPFVASQVYWSLAIANPDTFPADHVRLDDEPADFYTHADLTVFAFTAQARGFFAIAAAQGRTALSAKARQDFENAQTLARLARAQDLARCLDTSVTAVVLAYLTSQAITAIPIIGPGSVAHLRDALDGCDLTLTTEQIRYLTT
jgi:aryl-alcohol dehydrogenase-like predicted oxidoreductase